MGQTASVWVSGCYRRAFVPADELAGWKGVRDGFVGAFQIVLAGSQRA